MRISSFLLALALVLNLAVPAAAAEENGSFHGTCFEDMAYVPFDPEDGFYDKTDELASLAAGDDEQAVLDLYHELYSEYILAQTALTLATLHHSFNVEDRYWTDEYLNMTSVVYDVKDALCRACYEVLQGPCAQAFSACIGPDAVDALTDYEPMTDRESELLARESELTAQYDELCAAEDSLTFQYGGRNWTTSDLSASDGAALYYDDPDGYFAVSLGLEKAFNDLAGPIFLELVQLRTELAEIWGYDSYAAGMYSDGYGRDFSPEDAQVLCDAVKELAAAFYGTFYDSDVWFMYADVCPVLVGEELIAVLGEYLDKVDTSLEEPWRFMAEHDLYYLSASDDSAAEQGGYTTTIPLYNSPFIYNALSGSCYDLSSMFHEFGHYADAYYNRCPNELFSSGSYDLFEIHSTGLEALSTEFYGDIYESGADIARFIALGDMFGAVIEGCLYDEFQRRVYAQPDMTLDEVNELYGVLCREYGMPQDISAYSWQNIPHTFSSPFYYISYAVSSLAAIQIWDIAQTDWDAAADTYMDVLHRGAYEDGYMTVLSACGLRLFTEKDAAADICRPLLDRLCDLEQSALNAENAA